ncbi:heavy metal translocating P-type ATPase [Gorillibacterium massiliense]|uniref:heavy metal translocating P-type ATPase n=1 Tax=Gorillibacterium massiliense TaxID=1280390 RepID=UPI0004AD74B2|nr:heavy metal translocating P-type ATPase [Gorillibacterium massiliense]
MSANYQTAAASCKRAESTTAFQKWKNRYGELAAALIGGGLTAMGWVLHHHHYFAAVCFFILSFVIGGYAKAKEGMKTLLYEKDLDVNLLMFVAAIGAASIGYWTDGAVLIFIFSLSGALETLTVERSSRDISALMGLNPETATRYINGVEESVLIQDLQVGDIIIIKNGERIPADGVITEGASSVNQASITGESIPVDKAVGDTVFAGTLNGEGALFVQVTVSSDSTLFAKIIRLVQEAQSEMPKSERFMQKFERYYARAVVAVTILLILLPPWLIGWSWSVTMYKAMVFLVVASPCALVASIMPVMLSAISNGARKGLLFKGGAHLENLSSVHAVAFDKTGTLTLGKPVVTNIVTFNRMDENELLAAAASIESISTHPIAGAIVEEAESRGIRLARCSDFQAMTGRGVQANLGGTLWKIGKPSLFEEDSKRQGLYDEIGKLEKRNTVILVEQDGIVAGAIALQDRIRPEAVPMVAKLKSMGITVAMLTGDQQLTAEAIAAEAGIDKVYAGLLPEEKLNIVKQLKEEHGSVVMIGDGVNDAPALATATVGIAMGGGGSDAAFETADLILMNDDLLKISFAVELGRRMKRVVKQNIAFAAFVIMGLIISNFISDFPLPLGVFFHEGSTILVILNGLRLLR